MRWKFVDPQDASETTRRNRMARRIERWWELFAARARDMDLMLRGKLRWDLQGWMEENLQSLEPSLCWEFSSDAEGGHELVITPESRKELRPLVDAFLSRAPTLPGWTFRGYRTPRPERDARAMVGARLGRPLSLSQAELVPTEGNLVDLRFLAPDGESELSELEAEALVAAEALLGEEVLDRWIGGIEVVPAGTGKELPLGELRAAVEREVRAIRARLPDHALHEEPHPGERTRSLLKLEPRQEEDYAHQFDLLASWTFSLALWKSTHANGAFDSARFSRFETFCFVKMEGNRTPEERAELEEGLDRALRAAGMGAVTGGGTGLRYGYVDLALVDVTAGGALAREVLRKRGIPKRSWLLFYDSTLQQEWIALGQGAPAPLLVEFD